MKKLISLFAIFTALLFVGITQAQTIIPSGGAHGTQTPTSTPTLPFGQYGNVMTFSKPGYLVGLKFYHPSVQTATALTGIVWSIDSSGIAHALSSDTIGFVLTQGSGSSWVFATFTFPIFVPANTNIIVGYNWRTGSQPAAQTVGGLTSAIVNPAGVGPTIIANGGVTIATNGTITYSTTDNFVDVAWIPAFFGIYQ